MFIFGLLFLLCLGMAIGKRLHPQESIFFYSGMGLITLLASISVVGTLFYYLIGLPFFVIVLMIAGLIVTFLLLIRSFVMVCHDIRAFATEQVTWYRSHPRVEIIFTFFVAVFIAIIVILARSPIVDAVRSPWDRVPWIIFPLFFFLSCVGIYLIHAYRDNPSIKSTIRIVALLFFLIVSIGWLVFPIGYGFDSFIHQATEKLIAADGVVTPKPLYYIGQYSIVVFLSRFLSVSIEWIDKLLVPILSAILIPWVIGHWLQKLNIKHSTLNIIGILFLPFFLSQFTITTPQSLANLFLIILIFSGQMLSVRGQVLLATAALLIHPLAGIPAFIFVTSAYFYKKNRLLLTAYCFLAAIAIPAAFLLAAQLSSSIHVAWAPQNFLPWLQSIEWAGIYRENRFHAPWDLLYFYGFNVKNIFWFFVVTGLISWWKNKKIDQCLIFNIQCFFTLLGSYILMAGFLSFEFLIGYEQTDYTDRVLDIAYLFLLPFFLLGFGWWANRFQISRLRQGFGGRANFKFWIRGSGAVALALIMTASLYLTHPQNVDSYSVSHGFNTNQSDISAVHWIEDNAEGEPYIVLANQAVSAAAIREFGFKKYYGPYYFYPIPTGSPLYQYYLDMVYKSASRETMEKAMDIVGTDHAYFVLNRYWVNFAKIKKEASATADTSFSINDQDFIFEYHR